MIFCDGLCQIFLSKCRINHILNTIWVVDVPSEVLLEGGGFESSFYFLKIIGAMPQYMFHIEKDDSKPPPSNETPHGMYNVSSCMHLHEMHSVL